MEKHFSDRSTLAKENLAQLLGLTREEYAQLSHSRIGKVNDTDGSNVLYYYITISTLNPGYILDKLKMDNMQTIYFPVDSFEYKSYLPKETT